MRCFAGVRPVLSCSLSFREWANQRGVLYPKLEVFSFNNGLRGMRAIEQLKEGEIAVRVPRSGAIVVEPTTKAPASFPETVWKKQPWFVKLALRLMVEREAGQDSDYAGYTSCLPSNVDLPCFWSDAEIEELRYPPLITSILKQREDWNRLAGSFLAEIPEMNIDKGTFLQCLALVRSRSFSGPYIGSKLSDRIRLGVIIVFLAASNIALAGLGSVEQTLDAVLAVCTFNFLYDFFLSRRLKVYLLAPGVDFINHSGRVTCDLCYEYLTDAYTVRMDKSYDRDEQVFISYGNKSNDDLLQYFGFVEQNNPHDFVKIANGMSKLCDVFRHVSKAETASLSVDQVDVKIFREGFEASVIDALGIWVEEAGVKENLIVDVLMEFCRQEDVLLEANTPREAGSRTKTTTHFRSEKRQILAKCMENIEHQHGQLLIDGFP